MVVDQCYIITGDNRGFGRSDTTNVVQIILYNGGLHIGQGACLRRFLLDKAWIGEDATFDRLIIERVVPEKLTHTRLETDLSIKEGCAP